MRHRTLRLIGRNPKTGKRTWVALWNGTFVRFVNQDLAQKWATKWVFLESINAELLAACKAALHQFSPKGHYVDPEHPIGKVLNQLTDAIARAEGKTR